MMRNWRDYFARCGGWWGVAVVVVTVAAGIVWEVWR
jgi:hypothetical protein